MKRRLSIIAAALICGLTFTTCASYKETVKAPEVTLKSVDFSSIDFTGLTLLSKVDIKNNNSINLPFPTINWDLFVINDSFAKGVIQGEGSLKSRGSTEVRFPVSFTYADLIKVITSLTDDNAKYKIKMTVNIPVPGLGNMSWPFEYEGKIPLLRLPNISIAAAPKVTITYSSGIISLPTGANITFELNVKNNSNVAVLLNDLSYDFKIGSNSLSKGGVTGKPRINSGATEKVTVNFSIPTAAIAQIGVSALTGNNINYNITGNYKFGIPEFPLLNEVGNSFSLQR
jgi:LEA14-like dessication related protein